MEKKTYIRPQMDILAVCQTDTLMTGSITFDNDKETLNSTVDPAEQWNTDVWGDLDEAE